MEAPTLGPTAAATHAHTHTQTHTQTHTDYSRRILRSNGEGRRPRSVLNEPERTRFDGPSSTTPSPNVTLCGDGGFQFPRMRMPRNSNSTFELLTIESKYDPVTPPKSPITVR